MKHFLFKAAIFLLLVCLQHNQIIAEIITTDRRIDWSPGIPGGIPSYPIGVDITDYGAIPNDGKNDRAAILNAITACPSGSAVYFPPGTYQIDNVIEVRKSIVLRGAGPDMSRIHYTGGSGNIFHFTNGGGDESYIGIKSGYTKGSTTLTLAHTSNLSVDDIIYITQEDDGDLVDIHGAGSECTWCGPDEGDHCMGQVARITAVNGNTITIDKPMYFTYSLRLNPVVMEFTNMIRDSGIEDIYIKRMQYGDGASVWFDNAYHCWARNIESVMCGRSHILLTFSAACVIRDSKIYDGYDLGSSWGYAIFMMWSNSDHLIENNIVNHVRHNIVFEGGGSGCVMAYNYLKDPEDGDHNTPSQDISYHGAHPYMNLWEGNIGFQVAPDNTMGSNSHTTYFRNQITNQIVIPVDTGWLMWVMDIEKNSVYHNFVGNVLGHPGMSGYIYETDDCNVNKAIWHWGCPDQSGNNVDRSDEPKNTALRHGNFDYVTNSTKWDPSIPDQDLPDSYYLSSKPVYFGDLTWPPFGPDVAGYSRTIPAEVRFEGPVTVKNRTSSQPTEFSLSQNYPNPFNPTTSIEYSIPKRGYYSITVYSLSGKAVAEIIKGYYLPGTYKEKFDAGELSSGIYFYQLIGNHTKITKKMVLIK